MTSKHPTPTADPAAPAARPDFAHQIGERKVRVRRAKAAPAAAPAAPPPPPSPNPPPTPGPPPLPEPPQPNPPIPSPPTLAKPPRSAGLDDSGAPLPRRRLRDLYAGPFGKVELALLAAVAIVALALRLRDPLSSDIIGAEDPYRHMERTWDLIQGKGIGEYPPGLAILMAPFALMGPDVFYGAARFVPVAFGLGMVVATYALARAYLHPAGALVAALGVAIIPELVRRTDLLFPTAIDLMLVPLLFLLILKASEGSRRALVWAGGVSAFLLITHPWVFVLVLPPIAVFWLGDQARAQWKRENHGQVARVAMAAGMVPVAGLVLWMLDFGEIGARMGTAMQRMSGIAAEPSSITPLPLFVDFGSMIGMPLLGLAALGAVAVLVRPTRLGVLTLLYTVLLLPLILVDWFGLWYVPHRTVAYFAIGVAVLIGIGVSEAVRRIAGLQANAGNGTQANANGGAPVPKTKGQLGITLGALALVAFLAAPAAAADTTWYRIYEEDEFEAWDGIAAQDASIVMAGSWQGRMGYRATTGNDAIYSPDFFDSEQSRNYYIQQYPDLVVLVDKYTMEDGRNTAFLEDSSQWTLIGQWGDNRAYMRY